MKQLHKQNTSSLVDKTKITSPDDDVFVCLFAKVLKKTTQKVQEYDDIESSRDSQEVLYCFRSRVIIIKIILVIKVVECYTDQKHTYVLIAVVVAAAATTTATG